MRRIPDILPERLMHIHRGTQSNGLSDKRLQAAHEDMAATFAALRTHPIGLTQPEPKQWLGQYRLNAVAREVMATAF